MNTVTAAVPTARVAPGQGRSPLVRAACLADATKFLLPVNVPKDDTRKNSSRAGN
jgi:hypothetical protein